MDITTVVINTVTGTSASLAVITRDSPRFEKLKAKSKV
jgi:hypothetical protein